MGTNNNKSTRPDDVRRTEKHNRTDNISRDDGTMPRGVGSTDDLNAMQPRTTGSDEMATGSPVTSGEQNEPGNSLAHAKEREEKESHIKPGDRAAIKKSVREDVKKDTGFPTGAVYGKQGDIKAVPDYFPEAENKEPGK